MTPELIAELRDWFPFDGSLGGYSCDYMPTPKGPYDTLPDRWHEMLDEIERLRGEVALLESFHIKQTDRLIDEQESELERLRQLVRDAHEFRGVSSYIGHPRIEGHEGRDLSLSWSCKCMRSGVKKFDIPVDFSKKDVERHFRSWPRRAKALHAAHIEELLNVGAK